MAQYDSATRAAMAAGSLIIRDMVTIHGRDGDGNAKDYCFWTGEDDVSLSLVSAFDGTVVVRDFIGGAMPSGDDHPAVDPIVWTIGLEARTINVALSQLDAFVLDMVHGGDIRHAVVEVHRGYFSPTTGAIVSTPFPRFLGKVDGAPLETPAEGGEGSVTLRCISNTIELTRTNTALKSDAQQQLRSGDDFRQYADTAGSIELWWGEAKAEAN